MFIRTVRRLLVLVVLVSAIGSFVTATVTSAAVQHGIGILKGCESPTTIGQLYECSYSLFQPVNGDTATVTDITDDVAAAGSTPPGVSSGNILSQLSLTLTGGAACNVGQTACTIPFGGEISTADFGFYHVRAADFALPGNILSDTVTATYSEVCTGPGAGNCPVGNTSTTAGSSTVVQQFPSQTSTTIQMGGAAVTSVPLGSTVTDQATVSGTGAGTPTGTVTFTFFSNVSCTGTGTSAGTGTLASGVANSSDSEGPLTAGSYSFQASYGGDANYSPSLGGCEPLTVTKAASQTVTTVQMGGAAVTSVPLGSTVTDQATVSGTGAGTPTGTVTFTFFTNGSCTGTGTSAGSGTLSAGVANSSDSEGPLGAGSYSFQASYGGDSNYLSSKGNCEPFTVGPGTTVTATTVQMGGAAVTSVPLGSTVTDQATVSGTGAGTPTGTVTFTFFTNGTCTGTGTSAGTGTLASGVANSSDSEGPLGAGSYSFKASYGGDSNYLSSKGACEPLTVPKASSQTTTTVQLGSVAVTSGPLGSTVTDQATVSGSGAGTPTGSVTFTFFNNGACTGTGTSAGTDALAGGVANSMAEGPLAAGVYSFQATYGGDSNYLSSTGGCEPFTINQAQSATTTSVELAGTAVTTVPLGATVSDQATVTGTGAGTPTGTVTFTFFTNSTCTGTGIPAGTGTLASGVADSSSTEGPLTVGSYSYKATYGGDSNYLGSIGGCEPFTVVPVTTVTTTTVELAGTAVTSVPLGSTVSDQATVTGIGAGTPTGTVTFTFFTNGTCTGTGTSAGTGTLASGVANSFDSEGPLAAGSYSFQATYGGDLNYLSSTGACEPFTVGKNPTATTTVVQLGGATVTSVPTGATVTDQATVTGTGAGTPTGTVTFTFFTNGTCTGTGTSAGTGTLASGVAMSPDSEGPLTTAGAYSFRATYNGDSNYLSSTGSCEPLAVQAPALSITKVADATPVSAGTTIGFTITVGNSAAPGTATATAVMLNDPLPAGTGVDWTISPPYTGPGACSITGTVGTQVLGCSFGNMIPGATASVHISSPTTSASAGTYKNTATASASNAPSVSATATIVVTPTIPSTSLTEKTSAKLISNGTAVTFTYLEENTGSVGITGVTVTGSLCGPATFVSSSDKNTTTLDPIATWTYTCTITLTNSTAKTIKFVDKATATGTSVASGKAAPIETAKATVKVAAGPPPCGISVSISPNPVVETGDSDVRAIVQVEACASYAGDLVNIDSQQLTNSCTSVAFGTLQPGVHPLANSIQVVLDDDGNATVTLTGTDCTPGPSLVEADLVSAPYLTATTTLSVLPPNVTPSGVVGYPANEVETGDTTASGFSDVYAVFYVETDPVYAETTAEISSAQLASRCLGGVTWTSNQGTSTGSTATATIDNDGNAVFTFTGASCAPGTSTVIADILAGAHTTYSSNYTVDPPTVTPS
jgi:hypothetical protein